MFGGFYVPKARYVYDARRSGCLPINFDLLGFLKVHLNVRTRASLCFAANLIAAAIEPSSSAVQRHCTSVAGAEK